VAASRRQRHARAGTGRQVLAEEGRRRQRQGSRETQVGRQGQAEAGAATGKGRCIEAVAGSHRKAGSDGKVERQRQGWQAVAEEPGKQRFS
jgi:hypothetical protein